MVQQPHDPADAGDATMPTGLPRQEKEKIEDTVQMPRGPAAPAAPPDPLLGRSLGGCRLDALIGRGAMGAVYRARQVRLDRTVAVKVIRSEYLEDERTLRRFEVEARTVARFNNPHVITIHDVGREDGIHFLVMEFVEGRNLRQIARERPSGRLTTAEALDLLVQACNGLKDAQKLGVLHRDIKPDNLMLDQKGTLKIADFGLAKMLQEDLHMTMSAELTGTPLYMSPEQCRGSAKIDFRTDMYSLGASFFYLLTGEPPFKASSVYELLETKTRKIGRAHV